MSQFIFLLFFIRRLANASCEELLGSCEVFHLPSSRGTLIGEQPNAWELLHPRAVPSRHRGAERSRR